MIHLHSYGNNPAQPPLVVIPGIDGSIGSVQPIVEELRQDRRVILVDYTTETEKTLDALSTSIANVLREEVRGSFDLLGQSIGTILVAQVSMQGLPVRRVVLISTFLRLTDFKLKLSNLLAGVLPRRLYRIFSRPVLKWACGPVGDGYHHPFFDKSAESDPRHIIKRTGWEIGRDFRQDVGSISQRLLILMGAKDRFVPNVQREIHQLRSLLVRRDAKVVAVPGAGHVLLPTSAIGFAVLQIREFLT
ncbi:alpha/beta hydrolase [Mesorhizobium sp. M0913]|uniref:alpha/beta fold hydrolase n=1 Tax=unclassified Mesorhizobium TaxID=325217 RepID=UPI003336BA07